MDNVRLFLWLTVAMLLWLNYETWVRDYAPRPEPQPVTAEGEQAPAAAADLPGLPEVAPPTAAPESGETADEAAPTVRVRTDVLDVLISLQGADLVSAVLPEYPESKDRPDQPVKLLDPSSAERFVFQTGVRGVGEGPEPNHLVRFEAAADTYELSPGQDALDVAFEWSGGNGLSATKVYRFRRGEYRIGLDMIVDNGTAEPWRGAPYVQLLRRNRPPGRSMFDVDSYSFHGPVLYNGESYKKLDVDDLVRDPVEQTVTGGWLAAIQHHFLAAAVPPTEREVRYRATARDSTFLLSAVGPVDTVPAGQTRVWEERLFVGPKLQSQLAEVGEDLDLTVDYGMLTLLAKPLFWLLSQVHAIVGNWGWAIVIVTILIKLLFYKLTEMSGRSMAKMRALQPRLKALQERYKDDRQKLSQAMMELYRKEKINPAAGCLPILVQMPFFFAFYWVLLESVEMRQAPFMLWIDDLSSRDPFFVLPLLMGVAMYLQQKLNPAPPDPIQAKVMQFLPVVFTVFFAFFPAGLVLYWLTNTVLSALQQWNINRVIEKSARRA